MIRVREKKKTYKVGIEHRGVGLVWHFSIIACSESEAKQKALFRARHNNFTKKNAAYTVSYCKEL
jgi:hypothetical protein